MNGETTQYEYGLERIAAYTATDAESIKTQYVYDVRGSVIQTITGGVIAHISEITAAPQTQSYAYTPFGEQLGDKLSGYTYNAEYYAAATGMLNLRARQYETAMMRFAQPDIVRGYAFNAQTLNRYSYSLNSPITYGDPSGLVAQKLLNAGKRLLGGVAGAITGTVAAAKTAYTNSRKTGASRLRAVVDAGVAGALAISPSYRAGAQAGSKAKTLAGAIRSGASAGRRVGNYVGRSVAVASGESRQSQLTPKQRQALEKQQELLRKARNAVGAEYESILREIDRACSAYSGIAQAKDTPTEAATVHDERSILLNKALPFAGETLAAGVYSYEEISEFLRRFLQSQKRNENMPRNFNVIDVIIPSAKAENDYNYHMLSIREASIALANEVTSSRGWSVTQELFEHFMRGSGTYVEYDYDSNVSKKIIEDGSLANYIQRQGLKVGDSLRDRGGFEYLSGDLRYAIQHLSYDGITGMKDGKMVADLVITDIYDFALRPIGRTNTMDSVINDLGYVAQELGIGVEYRFTIRVLLPLE